MGIGAAAIGCGNIFATGSVKKVRPNIVFILADDQGWTGLSEKMDPDVEGSCSDYYQTPSLARLVKEGMRFSQGYAPAPVCSPTRHSIQFGKNPANLGITHNNYKYRQHCDPKFALGKLVKAASTCQTPIKSLAVELQQRICVGRRHSRSIHRSRSGYQTRCSLQNICDRI